MNRRTSPRWRLAVLGLALPLVLLSGCQQSQSSEGSEGRSRNPEKYDRDREYCNAQVGQYMATRRTIDDTRQDVLRGDRDRFGQGELPAQMSAYGDARSSDRFMSDCMQARGWAQPNKSWWQRTGTGFKL